MQIFLWLFAKGISNNLNTKLHGKKQEKQQLNHTSTPPEVNCKEPAEAKSTKDGLDSLLPLPHFPFCIASAAASKSSLSLARAASDILPAKLELVERNPPSYFSFRNISNLSCFAGSSLKGFCSSGDSPCQKGKKKDQQGSRKKDKVLPRQLNQCLISIEAVTYNTLIS